MLRARVSFFFLRTCILSDVNTSVSTSQAMMVTISSFIFIDGIPLRGCVGRGGELKIELKVSLFLCGRVAEKRADRFLPPPSRG